MALTPKQIEDLNHRNTIELVSTPLLVKEPVLLAATLARALSLVAVGGAQCPATLEIDFTASRKELPVSHTPSHPKYGPLPRGGSALSVSTNF